jgi:hypothetical protein
MEFCSHLQHLSHSKILVSKYRELLYNEFSIWKLYQNLHLNSKLMWTLFKCSIQVLYSQINLKLKSVLSLLIWIDFFSFLNKMINCRHICLFIDFENWQRVILYYNLSEKELMKVWSNLRIGPKFKLYHDLDHTNSYLLLSHLACWICITF